MTDRYRHLLDGARTRGSGSARRTTHEGGAAWITTIGVCTPPASAGFSPTERRRTSTSVWKSGRPHNSLVGVSRAKTPKVKRATTLAGAELAVLRDEWIGEHQRRQMLAEIRWLDTFLHSREEITGARTGAQDG